MLARKAHLSAEAIAQEVDGETVILDLKSEQYFSLDAIGTRIWQLLQESPSLQQAFDQLLNEYDVDAAELERDLTGLVESLAGEGLISLE